jgi:putative molybdopterin biosynthesis protein
MNNNMSNTSPGFTTKTLTCKELSKMLRIGKTKLYELLRSGELPSFRVGRLYRVTLADVERYIEHSRNI